MPVGTVINGLAVSAQVAEPEGNLVRLGRDDAAVFVRLAGATLSYISADVGGTSYVDTLPALAQAVPVDRAGNLYPTGTVNLRAGRYVLFVKPAYGLTPVQLLIASEPIYNYRVTREYLIPLEIVHLHAWDIYPAIGGMIAPLYGDSFSGGGSFGVLPSQSFSGGGAFGVLPSQSFSGGASYGVIASQSFSGGGSVSSVSYTVPSPNDGTGGHATTAFGFFLKVPAAPASDMALVDLNFGSSGYLRVKLTAALRIAVEMQTTIGSGSIADAYGGPIAINGWHWVGVNIQSPGGNQLNALVQGPGGVTPGGQRSAGIGGGGGTLTGVLSLGLPGSSPYLPFPNQAGWSMSKFYLTGSNSGTNQNVAPGMLTSDVGAGGTTIAYMCRQTPGAVASLTDTGAQGATLAAGPSGLTIYTDGPYA